MPLTAQTRPVSRPLRAAASAALAALLVSGGAVVIAPASGAHAAYKTVSRRLPVANPAFESGSNGRAPSYWSVSPTRARRTLKVVRVNAPSGLPRDASGHGRNQALWVWDNTRKSGAAARSRAVAAVPGRTYTATARVRVGSGTGARLYVEFYDARGRRLRLSGPSGKAPRAGRVATMKVSATAPAGTTAVKTLVYSSHRTKGSSYWDTVTLTESRRVHYTPPERRLVAVWNHDLEEGRDYAAPPQWAVSPSRPTSTRKAVRVSAPKPLPTYGYNKSRNKVLWLWDQSKKAGAAARSAPMTATAGRAYTVSATTYTGSGSPARLYVEFYSASGRRLLLSKAAGAVKAGRKATVSTSATAPAGTSTMRILAYSSHGTRGSSYWEIFRAYEHVPPAGYSPALGDGTVLFVGNQRVETTAGLSRVVHAGRKYASTTGAARPVHAAKFGVADGPVWSQLYGTVLYEDGRYRMWSTGAASGDNTSTWYAESADGRTFSAGRKVLDNVWSFGVVRNPNTADPAKKYLMLGLQGTIPGPGGSAVDMTKISYRAYHSADGVAWKALSSRPVLPFRDVANVSYDPVAKRFVAMSKQSTGSTRQAFYSTSKDFVHWTTPIQAVFDDSKDSASAHVYGSPVLRYGDQLLALPNMYWTGTIDGVKGPIWPQIAASSDGVHWDRPARGPLVRLGAAGQPDDGMILTANDFTMVGDKVRLYYGGWSAGHEVAARTSRIFYAEWDRDRFVGMKAAAGGGSLRTRALRPTGAARTVNAHGTVRVEVLDAATGKVIPGYGAADSTVVAGSHLAAPVTWGGNDLSALAGRDIKLRFAVDSGYLYSFRIS